VPAHLERLGVTSREMDVLLLVVEGLTNAEVAERLVVSPGTVKGYVERLLAKTGAANRTGLAAYLVER
jgi:non-specific serine/threonine protein kinase